MLRAFIRRRVSVFACAIATATLGIEFSLIGQPARATNPNTDSSVDLLCPLGTQTATYSPGLTLIQRPTAVTVEGALLSCVSSDPEINTGTYHFSGQGQFSCLLTSQAPFSVTYRWSNGKYSTVRYVSSVNQKVAAGSVVVSTGTVVDGEFKGDAAVRTVEDTTLQSGQCATSEGVTSTTGAASLTFTKL